MRQNNSAHHCLFHCIHCKKENCHEKHIRKQPPAEEAGGSRKEENVCYGRLWMLLLGHNNNQKFIFCWMMTSKHMAIWKTWQAWSPRCQQQGLQTGSDSSVKSLQSCGADRKRRMIGQGTALGSHVREEPQRCWQLTSYPLLLGKEPLNIWDNIDLIAGLSFSINFAD